MAKKISTGTTESVIEAELPFESRGKKEVVEIEVTVDFLDG